MRRGAALVAGIALVSTIASCDIGTVNVPSTTPGVVVHAVLNPSASSQVVLLERTLTGSITIPDTGANRGADPIVSDGGIPISGATVEIIDSTGRTVRGIEDATTNTSHQGLGVYRVQIPGSSLVLGGRYRLHVRTAQGEELTASTRIPKPAVRSIGGLNRTFNVDHDVSIPQWQSVPGASSYFVRVETPFSPFLAFTDSTRFQFTGQLRNLFSEDLRHVFQPGFRQDILIAAVDSNFYDYYRTGNDPFTGSGIINRVVGGIGLFGALVTVSSGTFTVTADQTPPEGRYVYVPKFAGAPAPLAAQLVLYIESRAARLDLPDALTGRYTVTNSSRTDAFLGTLLGNSITLALLQGQASGDTVDVITGEIHGDTIVGTARSTTAPVTYVRVP